MDFPEIKIAGHVSEAPKMTKTGGIKIEIPNISDFNGSSFREHIGANEVDTRKRGQITAGIHKIVIILKRTSQLEIWCEVYYKNERRNVQQPTYGPWIITDFAGMVTFAKEFMVPIVEMDLVHKTDPPNGTYFDFASYPLGLFDFIIKQIATHYPKQLKDKEEDLLDYDKFVKEILYLFYTEN